MKLVVEILDGSGFVYLEDSKKYDLKVEGIWKVDFEVGGISDVLRQINRLELDSIELHGDCYQSTLEKLLTKCFEFGREFERGRK